MRVFQKLFFGLGACLFLFVGRGVQSSASDADLSLDQITAWLEGQYSNEQQVADGVMDAESNLLFPVFERVDIPAFGSHVIYLQWPIGSPEGRLQRQRIWTFAHDDSGDGVLMNFFTLKKPDLWRDAHLTPAKVKNMTPEDTIGYPDWCLLPVTFVGGQIKASIPSTCEIVSQSTRTTMTLQSQMTITEDQITYQEGGVGPDGTLVFQVPPTDRYVFKQLTD